MNKEVQEILERLKQYHPGPKIDQLDHINIQKAISLETARLSVLLAEEQAKSARKLEVFTLWLIGLTIALVLFSIPDFVRAFDKICH
jgi:hypothetical protein